MSIISDYEESLGHIKNGDTIIVGAFSCRIGAPTKLLQKLLESGYKALTIVILAISNEDDLIVKMIKKGAVKKIIIGFNNSNTELEYFRKEGLVEVEFVPYGVLIEKVRAGGSGIGAFYTKVGVGTMLEEGKEIKYIQQEKMLLEYAITADVALLNAWKSDKKGNLMYWGNLQHLNHFSAACANFTIAEVEELVDDLGPEKIKTPSIFVDRVVVQEGG